MSQDNYLFFLAAENMTLLKYNIPKNIVPASNTYCLAGYISAIETHQLELEGKMTQIEVFTETSLWILASNGNLYEYDPVSRRITCIENTGQITRFILWYVRHLNEGYLCVVDVFYLSVYCSRMMYTIIGCKDGSLLIYSISTENASRLEHVSSLNILQKFHLHHPIFCYRPPNLFVYNSEETIVHFHLNTCSTEPKSTKTLEVHRPLIVEHSHNHDIVDDELTLEEQKQIETENRRLEDVETSKSILSTTCSALRQDLDCIKKLNTQLPKSSRINSVDFVIDERITEEIHRTMRNELVALQNEMGSMINRIHRRSDTLHETFLYNMDHWTFYTSGFK